MFSAIFNAILYKPLYNGLILLIDLLPGANAGLAVVALTLAVRVLLFPLSKKAVYTQMKMKEIQPKLEELKKEYSHDQALYAKKMMELYSESNINPFSTIAFSFLQLPIILALYFVFYKTGLPVVNSDLLYGFVSAPAHLSMVFLGIDISQKSIILAALAALATFFQMRLTMPALPQNNDKKQSFGADFGKAMSFQMKYLMPLMIFFIAWKVSGVIALYWFTSNIFTIGQELYMRKTGLRTKQ